MTVCMVYVYKRHLCIVYTHTSVCVCVAGKEGGREQWKTDIHTFKKIKEYRKNIKVMLLRQS